MIFLALPAEAYRRLSDEAAKRGLTISELFSRAIDQYVGNSKPQPRLLTENR